MAPHKDMQKEVDSGAGSTNECWLALVFQYHTTFKFSGKILEVTGHML
jgi:hypothetical protein